MLFRRKTFTVTSLKLLELKLQYWLKHLRQTVKFKKRETYVWQSIASVCYFCSAVF